MTKRVCFLGFFVLLFFCQGAIAASTGENCQQDLKNIIAYGLRNDELMKGNSKKIQLDLDSHDGGVYVIRVSVPKPPTPDNPNTSSTIGWVSLDVNQKKIFNDLTPDGNPIELKINKNRLRKIIKECSL
jgi:hypothetical protein